MRAGFARRLRPRYGRRFSASPRRPSSFIAELPEPSLAPLEASPSGREQQPGAASRHSRFNESPRPAVRLLDARACGREQAPRILRWPLLLRLAERHCDPGGVRVEVHRLVDCRGDAVVRRARRDRWFSSIPQEVRAPGAGARSSPSWLTTASKTWSRSPSLMTRSLDVVALGERELVLVLELLHRGERYCPDHVEAAAGRAPRWRFVPGVVEDRPGLQRSVDVAPAGLEMTLTVAPGDWQCACPAWAAGSATAV